MNSNRYGTFSERNMGILNARLSGETLEKIAKDFGITRERVRQILCKQARICKSIPKVQEENDRLQKEVVTLKSDIARAGVPTLTEVDSNSPLKDLELNVGLWNCIVNAGHQDMTIKDASRLQDTYWLSLPNFGRKRLNELRDALHHANSSARRYGASSRLISAVMPSHPS